MDQTHLIATAETGNLTILSSLASLQKLSEQTTTLYYIKKTVVTLTALSCLDFNDKKFLLEKKNLAWSYCLWDVTNPRKLFRLPHLRLSVRRANTVGSILLPLLLSKSDFRPFDNWDFLMLHLTYSVQHDTIMPCFLKYNFNTM